ncbi:MAG: hypothetical protein CRN43_17855 [Candidatus Nephrothrix sp. EaCA]|nr:MAG: hypothetical protein CRN43_17855 [Candidatus Nephrothrix sp. EaCA]
MTAEERIEAAYQHSIIRYFSNGANTSLRERFKLGEKQTPQISRLIKDALEKGKIKLKDPEGKSKKFSWYVPYWA